jgi:hypothetical protein
MIVRADAEVLVLMNGWQALIIRIDDVGLVLVSLAVKARVFFQRGILRQQRGRGGSW